MILKNITHIRYFVLNVEVLLIMQIVPNDNILDSCLRRNDRYDRNQLSPKRTRQIHNRLKDTDSEESYHDCHHHEDDRFDEFLDIADRYINFFIVELSDLDDGIADLSCLFTHTDHRDQEIREEWVIFERFCDLLSVFDILSEEEDSLTIYLVTYGTRDDTDRLDDCHSTSEEIREHSGKS